MFRPLLAILREVFNKGKYNNGYLCYGCAMVDLKYKYIYLLRFIATEITYRNRFRWQELQNTFLELI
jgi:hypothetical protein